VPLNTVLTPAQAATVVFVPTPDYNGPVNPVTFTVTDNAGAVSAPANVTIANITPVADIVGDHVSTGFDAPVTYNPITGANTDGSPTAPTTSKARRSSPPSTATPSPPAARPWP
jgi:hypothetical protein